jgi:hypothetical protein
MKDEGIFFLLPSSYKLLARLNYWHVDASIFTESTSIFRTM